MAFTSYQALLTQYLDAISGLSDGTVKEYYIGSRRVTRYDLKELREMVDWLQAKVDDEGGGRIVLAQYERPI